MPDESKAPSLTESARRAPPLAGSALAVTAASAFFVVAGYAINVALGRALGPVDYGLFGVVIGLMTVVNALQTSAIPQAMAKFAAERRYALADLLVTGAALQIGSGLLLAFLLLLLAEPVAATLNDADLAGPLRIAALAFPAYALLTLLMGVETGRGRYVRQAFMMSVYSAAKAVLAIGLGLALAVPGAIAGYVLAPLVASVTVGTVPDARKARFVPMRPLLAFATPLLVLAALSMAYLNLDLFLVKSLVPDPASAGYYTAAQNVARVPYFLSTGLATILIPAVARIAMDDRQRAGLMVSDALRFGILIVLPTAVVLFAAAQDVVQLLFGEPYAAAAAPLQWLSAAMGVFALFSFVGSMLAGVGRPSSAVIAVSAGLLVTAAVGITLTPSAGMRGAAAGTLAGALVAFAVGWIAMFRALRFTVPWLTLVRVGVASAAVGLIAYNLNGPITTLFGIVVAGLVYFGLLIVTRELGRDDWTRLRAMVPARSTTH